MCVCLCMCVYTHTTYVTKQCKDIAIWNSAVNRKGFSFLSVLLILVIPNIVVTSPIHDEESYDITLTMVIITVTRSICTSIHPSLQ